MSQADFIKKILCPVDFSEFSHRCAEEALILAEKFGAEIVFLNVVNQHSFVEIERVLGRFQHFDGMDEALRVAIDTAENERVEKMKTFLVEVDARRAPHLSRISVGVPYEKILETAEKDQADLIVMSTHGRGSLLKQLRFGSNAEKVFRRSKCRVLFIR